MPVSTTHIRPSRAYRALLLSGGMVLLALGRTVAGDLLRGGYTMSEGGRPANPGSFTPPSEVAARANLQDQLARATQAIQAVRQLQTSARAIALAAERNNAGINPNNSTQLPNIPNGLGAGGLEPAAGAALNSSLWSGATLPTQTTSGSRTVVTVDQTSQDAVLTWSSFSVGRATTLDFNQGSTGASAGNSIVFNIIEDPTGVPSQILGSIHAQGQVYVINQNGIIFGAGSQVNVHTLVASSLPINTNLISRGLLNNPDDQFLFSQLAIPAGANGPTPAFDPPAPVNAQDGDVIVQAGAQITAPANADSTGGRVALIGPDVTNDGTISTPDGQTILAAGEQVGFLASSDATLRGLDTYIGAVDASTGIATNDGLIEVDQGDATIAGKAVNQLGVINSTTSVTLNGRIDLDASYGTEVVSVAGNGTDLFVPTATGMVTLGAGSETNILPDVASSATVVGTQLALSSEVNIEGETIHFATNSQLLAPDASVAVSAGGWVQSGDSPAQLIPNSGQIYLDAGATIDVAGSIVSAPVSQNIVSAELLGPELADSPLQRNGVLYGQTISVDARESGVYDGVEWVGTPLANVSGYIDLIELPVGELTTAGGAVNLTAGGSVVMQPTSQINVSGGAVNYQGGMVQTTYLLYDGQIINIADATPDLVYQGIVGQFTVSSAKWGIEQSYTTPLVGGAVYQDSYAQGGNGGSISIAAPTMALDGQLLGQTTTGPRQLATPPAPGSLTLSFQMQTASNAGSLVSPTPPVVTFQTDSALPPVPAFAVDSSGNPIALPALNQHEVLLSPDLLTQDGFGSLTVNNGDGNIIVPANVDLNAPAFGSISLNAANLTIDGSITAPDGTLDFSVYDFSPYTFADNGLSENVAPPANPGRGHFVLGASASLSTAGLIVDNVLSSSYLPPASSYSERQAIGGGSISIDSYSADLEAGSSINVSGGVLAGPAGALTYGAGGALSIKAGQDPNVAELLGGTLTLDAALTGFSGGKGGSLTILAPEIQIGGASAGADSLLLQPGFFDQGGFATFSLTGLGIPTATSAATFIFAPAILVAPGATLAPVAENWLGILDPVSADGLTLTAMLLPEAQRTPVSLSFNASGVENEQAVLITRGDFVLGNGATIATDPGGSVSIHAQTVTVLGDIDTPGGAISITGASNSDYLFSNSGAEPLATVYLGPDANLSAAGATVLTPDVYGDLTGSVLAGGDISIGGNIVAAAGSVLNVSGASGLLYLPQSETTLSGQEAGSFLGAPVAQFRVDSNGGSIMLSGAQELFTDATLIGAAGGPSAIGGSVSFSSGVYTSTGYAPNPTDPALIVTQGGRTIPAPTGIGQAVLNSAKQPVSLIGGGFITVDRFQGGGFNSVTLEGSVQFNGNVTITAGGSLTVGSVAGGNGGVIIADGAVSLNAPYVALGLPFEGPLTNTQEPLSPFILDGIIAPLFDPTSGSGSLTVHADLIDAGTLSLLGISQTTLDAANGDIRGDGVLDVAGQLNLTAGQIYPASDVTFTIADYAANGQPGTVTIHAAGSRDLPLSAGGTLDIYASVIDQDGVLRAPLGTINLGWNGASGAAPTNLLTGAPVDSTTTLTLGSQSITSVSAVDPKTGQALIIPFGSNPAGTEWIDPAGNNITAGGVPAKAINLAGTQIVDKAGSVIDMSGGGDLSSYEFIAGEGGSTDFLNPGEAYVPSTIYSTGALVTYKGNTYVADQESVDVAPGVNQYWSEVPTSYAVIPGYQATYAPYAPFNAAVGDPGYISNNLEVGQQVYLGAGSGLAAGIYTLLPARYALLPGAFLVTPETGTPAAGQTEPDGSNIVSGYQFNGLSNPGGLPGPLISLFEVESQSVVLSRGQYQSFLADRFLAEGAVESKVAVPLLPIDAGQLNFNAGSQLTLQGIVDAEAPAGGAAGFVDINSSSAIDITSASSGGQAGALTLSSSELSSFGAANLLIGGVTTTGADGTTVMVETDDVTVESGATLTGGDIILVANETLTVGKGATIAALGALGGQAATLLVQDQDELQAPGDNLAFTEGGVPITFPNGTAGNQLSATATVTVTTASGGVTTYSAGSAFSLGAGSTVTLAAGGGTISFLGGTGGPIPVLVGDGTLLQASGGAPATIVRSGVAGLAGGVTGGSPTPVTLDISGGATISGAGVTLNSTAGASIGGASTMANISGKVITVGAGRVSLQLNNPGSLQPDTPGLVLAQDQLDSLKASETLSLLSYSSIDVYGSGSIGSATLANLSLDAGEIRGFNTGGNPATFEARNIEIENSVDESVPGPVVAAPAAGTVLAFDGGTINLGAGNVGIDQFANVQLNATGEILAQGAGELASQADLAITTPLLTGAAGSAETLSSAGALSLLSTAGSTVKSTGGLNAGLTLEGASVTDNGAIAAPSGKITLHATGGDVVVGNLSSASLDAGGTVQVLVDQTKYTSGGAVMLLADNGSVDVDADATINVAAQAGGGNAGLISISVPNGSVSLVGALSGKGGAGGEGGSFSLDAGSIPSVVYNGQTYAGGSVDSIDDILDAGGFTQSISIRDRTDTGVTLDGAVTAASYNLSADVGSISIYGTINADDVAAAGPSGNAISVGGSITLTAAGSVTLENGSVLNVSAQNFNNAGQGGAVTLSAGAGIVNGPNGSTSTNGSVDVEAGSTINLSVADSSNVAAAVESLLKAGQTPAEIATDIQNTNDGNDFAGTLLIEAPETASGGVQVDPIVGTIIGAAEATTTGGTPVAVPDASSIVVDGYRVYNTYSTATSQGTTSGGVIDGALEQLVANNGVAFLGAAGATPTANYTNLGTGLAGSNAELGAAGAVNQTSQGLTFNIETGVEIIDVNPSNPSAVENLTLSGGDWNLSAFRFGPNGTAGQLTLRASGNLIFDNTLSDGFTSSAYTATLLPQNPNLPANIQSWSYTLTAGADMTAAAPTQVIAGNGSLELGINDPDPYATSPGTGATVASAVDGAADYYQVIRTGAGSIDIAAGSNVELLNQFATIYTAGTPVLDPTMDGAFRVPNVEESSNPSDLGNSGSHFGAAPAYDQPEYSEAGGDVTIAADMDIDHLTQNIDGVLVMDSEAELPDNWLFRRGDVASSGLFDSNSSISHGGDPSESTAWWIDFSNFFEGVGALGGGNVAMTAGGDIANVDAVVPTNARMPGINTTTNTNLAPSAASLVELGGGNLLVQAGDDINAGVYYVENGHGTITAGNQILTNATRAPVGGENGASAEITAPSDSWLPTTLFAGDASFDITAGGNILLGPVANVFLLPEGLLNDIWYKTYFSTFATTDAVNVASLGGSITFREEASSSANASGNAEPMIEVWLQNMDLLSPASRSYYQPWLLLNEDSTLPFETVTNVMPATLGATAYSGNINVVGSILLSPSPTGGVDFAAAGSINGFQSLGLIGSTVNWITAAIDISDADPASVPGIASPFGYQEVPGVGTNSIAAGTSAGGSVGTDFLGAIANIFNLTETGAAGVVETEQALHDSDLLHAADPNPVQLYAVAGDISGVTLYSPTETRIVAGGDITDIALYLQNDDADEVSVISAGGNIIAYDPSSPSREAAQSETDDILGAALPGDIQIAGPGTLEVLAGSNLELGGQGPGGPSNTTGDGIASIGNTQNPALPFSGADVVAAAGIGGSAGLGESELDFSAFISQYIDSPAGAAYLGELNQINSAYPGVTSAASFSALTPSQQDLLALDVFFLALRDAGRDHNLMGNAGFGNYDAGLAAIAALFPKAGPGGDIDVTSRDIVTESGGNISLLAPNGEVTAGLNSAGGNDVTNLGIVTQDGGNISIFTSGDVNVGTSRIFTLAGGNEIIWSSDGNIDAGASSKTVQSAPPTRVLVDPQSANVQTDLAGLATGGGIGVLASVAGVPVGNVDLIAPTGIVNAGEAGIRATGNLNIAAVQVLNAGNISAGGASTGLPPAVAAPNIAGLTAASSVAGSAINSAPAAQTTPAADQDQGGSPIVTVQVIGYGGGDDDGSTNSSNQPL